MKTSLNPLSARQMSRILKHYSMKSGDIIALKHQSENANPVAIDAITKALTQMNIDALVIVVDDFEDLSVLNETEMNKQGWYNLRSLAKIMKLPEKTDEQ
jgi:hypothetical protein